jgi:hypothetical protein
VTLDFSRPASDGHVFVEAFDGRLRDECMNSRRFLPLADARSKIEAWWRTTTKRGSLFKAFGSHILWMLSSDSMRKRYSEKEYNRRKRLFVKKC